MSKEFTEEIIEGIYAEQQYKIENLPGYGEAYKRAFPLMKKIFNGAKLSEQEQKELDEALGEMMFADMMHCYGSYGIKPKSE